MSLSRPSTAHRCVSAPFPGDVATEPRSIHPSRPAQVVNSPCRMMKLLNPTLLIALLAALIQSASGQILKLTPMSTFGTNGNGSVKPDETDYLTRTNQLQRGMAW